MRPQFSLLALGGVVAFAAVASCSLVYASPAWSSSIYTAAIVFLAFATLAAVYSRQEARAFWLGSAFGGWLYLLLLLSPLAGTQQVNTTGQVNVYTSELATTHLADWFYSNVLPKLRSPPRMPPPGAIFYGPQPAETSTYPDQTSFIRVSHALWIWLFALAGGITGKWLYRRHERSNPGSMASTAKQRL